MKKKKLYYEKDFKGFYCDNCKNRPEKLAYEITIKSKFG